MTDLLAGTTILEFGGGAAGPVATRYFADHGATVIRVESRQRPDFLRILKLTPNTPGRHRRRRALRRPERQQALGRPQPLDGRRRRGGAPAGAAGRRRGGELRARRDGEVGPRLRIAGAASGPTW